MRVLMYGIGSVGSTMTRMLLERGATIVGAVAASQEKNGKDVGELVGLDTQLGARVYTDPDEALTLGVRDVVRDGVSERPPWAPLRAFGGPLDKGSNDSCRRVVGSAVPPKKVEAELAQEWRVVVGARQDEFLEMLGPLARRIDHRHGARRYE